MKNYYLLFVNLIFLIIVSCSEDNIKSKSEYTLDDIKNYALQVGLSEKDFDFKITDPSRAELLKPAEYEQLKQLILQKSNQKKQEDLLNKRHKELALKMKDADETKDTARINQLLKEYSDIIIK